MSRRDDRLREALTDEALMAQYLRGDEEAFRHLVRRHQSALYNFALRYVQASSTAEDVVQEVFVRVVQSGRDFRMGSRFSTWVYAIARNLCLDTLRKGTHRRHASLDAPTLSQDAADAPTLGEHIPDAQTHGPRAATREEIKSLMDRAIGSLPDDQRDVFLLRELAGLPFKEIADMTGISENTLKSRMRYALERLQEALREYEDFARTPDP